MADDPDLTGNIRLNLTPLINGLRFAQAVTRRQIPTWCATPTGR